VQTFPGLVVAGPFGFSIREFFEVEDQAQREPPSVDF
jgi:LemA protein